MKLENKFKQVFILPLISGILLSIILTMMILLISTSNLIDEPFIKKMIKIESGRSDPIKHTVHNLIYKKFQKAIYSLRIIKTYYEFYLEKLNITNISDKEIELIKKYMKNSIQINDNYNSIINDLQSGDNSTYLDQGYWHYDNKINDPEVLQKMKPNTLKQLYLFMFMIPSLRAIYETSANNRDNRLEFLYYANKNTNLFLGYPIIGINKEFFEVYGNASNVESCKTEEGVTPEFYYFKCRDWWTQLVEYNKYIENEDLIITHPYVFANNGKYGVTLCIKLFKTFEIASSDPYSRDMSSFCLDLDIYDMVDNFDYFNKELPGYFYILTINSDIPIYYPSIFKYNNFSNIARYEFDMTDSYYVKELAQFISETVPRLIKNYDDDSLIKDQEFSFKKNGFEQFYIISPIKLYTGINNTNPTHMFTYIYVRNTNLLRETILKYVDSTYSTLIVQIILFLIMGIILILIATYLITSIATIIVKPIKNLKYIIQGMKSNSNENDLKDNKLKLNSQKKKDGDEYSVLISEFHELSDNEEDIYDEEDLDVRSEEFNRLFDILLKLKNVISFTTNSLVSSDKRFIVNYVNAKYTFGEVSNEKGKNLCDSNVGNLAIRCLKHDKAIFHLIQSMPEIRKKFEKDKKEKLSTNSFKSLEDMIMVMKNSKNNNLISKFLRNSNSKNVLPLMLAPRNSDRNTNDRLTKSNEENSEEKRNSLNKELLNKNKKNVKKSKDIIKNASQILQLESRYPKLIYAYKMFYKNLGKILKKFKNQNFKEEDINERLNNLDLYVNKETHSLEAYEKVLLDYILVSTKIEEPRRTAEAILEYIEFLIIYKLKPDDQINDEIFLYKLDPERDRQRSNEVYSITNNNTIFGIQQNKKEILNEIGKYFRDFDIIYKSLKSNCTSEYFKSFLDLFRRSKKDKLEMVDSPFLVLFQKSNYLKGKVALTCGHYDRALEYFNISKESLIICDASIIKKSIKKILKITEILRADIENEIEIRTENLIKSDTEKDKIEIEQRSYLSLNSTSLYNEKKAKEKIESLKAKSKHIESYILYNLNMLDNFCYIPKDMLILVDVSLSMKSEPKKLERAFKTANNFFQHYITSDDRFGLFTYETTVNTVLSLTEKNLNTYVYIKNLIESLIIDPINGNIIMSKKNNINKLNDLDSKSDDKESNSNSISKSNINVNPSDTCKAVCSAFEYLYKKNSGSMARDKWIILFTDSFEVTNIKNLNIFSELRDIREKTNEQINVIAVGINMNNDHANRLKDALSSISKKSGYIDIDNISNFSSILKVHGDIKPHIEFANERYESDKIKRNFK